MPRYTNSRPRKQRSRQPYTVRSGTDPWFVEHVVAAAAKRRRFKTPPPFEALGLESAHKGGQVPRNPALADLPHTLPKPGGPVEEGPPTVEDPPTPSTPPVPARPRPAPPGASRMGRPVSRPPRPSSPPGGRR